MTQEEFAAIKRNLASSGWDDVPDEDIIEFQRTGGVPESTVGEDYDLAYANAMEDAFDKAEVEIG